MVVAIKIIIVAVFIAALILLNIASAGVILLTGKSDLSTRQQTGLKSDNRRLEMATDQIISKCVYQHCLTMGQNILINITDMALSEAAIPHDIFSCVEHTKLDNRSASFGYGALAITRNRVPMYRNCGGKE